MEVTYIMWMNTNLEKDAVKILIPKSRLYKDEMFYGKLQSVKLSSWPDTWFF